MSNENGPMAYRWSTTASTGNYNPDTTIIERVARKIKQELKTEDMFPAESVPLEKLKEDGAVDEPEKKEFLFDPKELDI